MFVLLGTILLLIIIPFLLPFILTPEKYDSQEFKVSIAKLNAKQTDSFQQNVSEENYATNNKSLEKKYSGYESATLFYFDPNTLSAEGWKKLGVNDKTIHTIQNYLFKGGRFYKPDDINKIWGFHKDETDKLIPYVRIEKTIDSKESKENNKKENNDNAYAPYKKANKEPIDINTADTSAFIALPGIASKLANRIVTFRNQLGGFYKIEQIEEIYGLRDSVFQLIKPRLVITTIPLTQFNINTATVDQMKVHPYIRYAIANAIVQYRTQHGNYVSIADIKKIVLVTDDAFNKMSPYLKVTE